VTLYTSTVVTPRRRSRVWAKIGENTVRIALISLLEEGTDSAKVGLKSMESISERRQSLSGIGERRGVEIHSDDACAGGGFQNCFAVSAKANRAIYKETSSLRSEEFQCLF